MKIKTFDWALYLFAFLLWLVGLATIYATTYFSGRASLALDHLIFGVIGIGLMIFFTFLDYRAWRSVVYPLFIVGILLLAFVLYFGKNIFGATRWINLGFFQLQPSELMKLFLILFLARFWGERDQKMNLFAIVAGLILVFIPLYLVLKQPDFGTAAVLFFATVVVLFSLGLKRIYYFFICILFAIAGPLTWLSLKSYQKERLLNFLNPLHDPMGSGYNILQSLIAVGSGGIWGQGLSESTQSQLSFLPVAHTDFIFAGFAEITGFSGSLILILIFFFFIWRIINVARVSRDNFGAYFAVGAAAIFLFQFIVNIGMNIGIMPVTGIPLPFVSHGGSALLVDFIMVGILQSIYIRHKKIAF